MVKNSLFIDLTAQGINLVRVSYGPTACIFGREEEIKALKKFLGQRKRNGGCFKGGAL